MDYAIKIARYVVCFLLIQGFPRLCKIYRSRSLDLQRIIIDNRVYITMLTALTTWLMYTNATLIHEEFLLLFLAYLITKHPDIMDQRTELSYAVGMACGFFEGYISQVMASSDGEQIVGFEESIITFERTRGVVFPVRILFIIVPKSLYCAPTLEHYNRNGVQQSYLESVPATLDQEGLLGRVYRTGIYKIMRDGKLPVYITADLATPLHTLYRITQNRTLYSNLKLDKQEIVDNFCEQLERTIERSPECRGRCVLILYDDTNTLNLSDVLLDKIKEIQPDFETVIERDGFSMLF